MNRSEAGKLGFLKSRKTVEKRKAERRSEYLKNPKKCQECNKIIAYENRNINKFCSSSCGAIFNNHKRKPIKLCINCGSKINKGSSKYCSKQCNSEYEYKDFIEKWLIGEITGYGKYVPSPIRRWLGEQKGEECWMCGWKDINRKTGKVPVQVDHINGIASINRPENLRLLCPNCHSLTETYSGLNKGNGRSWRYKK